MKTRSTVGFLLFKYINTDLAHRNLFQTLLGQVKQIRPNRLKFPPYVLALVSAKLVVLWMGCFFGVERLTSSIDLNSLETKMCAYLFTCCPTLVLERRNFYVDAIFCHSK